MSPRTRSLTLAVLIAIIITTMANVALARVLDSYDVWFAWTIFTLTWIMTITVLRYQQHLSTLQMSLILVAPLLVATIGAIVTL